MNDEVGVAKENKKIKYLHRIIMSYLEVFKTDMMTRYLPDLLIEIDLTRLENGFTIMYKLM